MLVMRKFSLMVIVSVILALMGCTTFVAKSKKIEGYDKKVTETKVIWQTPLMMRTRISRSAQGYRPSVCQEDKKNSKVEISKLLKLFKDNSAERVSGLLQKKSITVITGMKESSATRLIITPTQAETNCAPLGCASSLWVHARLRDNELKKDVWSGSFKVGAHIFEKNDVSVIDSFANELIDLLAYEELI